MTEPQQQGVASAIAGMNEHGGFVLADGTGVGKTRQILGVAKAYADKGLKVLIVAPAGVLKQDWKKGTVSGSYADDSAAMGMETQLNRGDKGMMPGQIHMTTYENLGEFKRQVDSNTVVIYDECHALKNWQSSRAKNGKDLSSSARAVLYASATPADKPMQIGYLFRAKVFGNRTYVDVMSELGMHQVTQRTYGGGSVQKWEINPRVGMPEVYRRMSGLFDRMTKDGLMIKREVSLDGLEVAVDKIELSADAQAEMRSIASKYPDDSQRGIRLMSQRMAQERYKIPAAVTAIKQELAAGRQVVLFGASVNATGDEDEDEDGGKGEMNEGTMIRLREVLTEAGISFAELHGAATKAQQRKGMEDFQSGKVKVVIGTVQSGGTGVNLDDRSGKAPRTVVVMTPPFSGMENVQAAGRVHRMTTRSESKIKYLMADTEVDDWNARIIRSKMATLGATVGGDIGKLDVPGEYAEMDKRLMGEKLIAQKGAYEWPALTRQGQQAAKPPTLPTPKPAEAPKTETPKPDPAKGAEPKALEQPKSPAPSISTRVVSTRQGQRHVHGFAPSQRFWTAWRKWKDSGGKPEYLSVSKNPRTGEWEAAIWGATPQQVAGYRDDLMRRLERFAARYHHAGRELYSVLSAMALDKHERYALERMKAFSLA